MPPSLPLRMMRDGDAILAAAQDLASRGFCLLAMDESDDAINLPESTLILADHTLSPGALLRRRMAYGVISARFGNTHLPVRFSADAYGAPKLEGAPTPLHLSFSARNSLGVVGIGTRPLGVDLEFPIEADAIPLNILREDERRALLALENEDRVLAFLRLWTLKEAMVKANGSGFSIPPESVTLIEATHVEIRNRPAMMHCSLGTILTSETIRAFTGLTREHDERRRLTPFISAIGLLPDGI